MKKFPSDLSSFVKKIAVEAANNPPDRVFTPTTEVESGTSATDRIAIYLEKMYHLLNKHLPNENDQIFDMTRLRRLAVRQGVVPNHSWACLLAGGAEFLVLQYPVPAGYKLVVTHYNFFGMIDMSPIIPQGAIEWNTRWQISSPLEHAYKCSFVLKSNGQPVSNIFANHDRNLAIFFPPGYFPAQGSEGFTLFSTQASGDTNSDFGAVYLEYPPGSLFEVWFRNIDLFYGPIVNRDLYAVGARIRGYLRPIT